MAQPNALMVAEGSGSPEQPGVYSISDARGRCYIGGSIRPRRRWTQHLYELRNGRHSSPALQNVFDLDGLQGLTFCVLLNVPAGMLLRAEQLFLDKRRPELNAVGQAGPSRMHLDPVYLTNLRVALRSANERDDYRQNRRRGQADVMRGVRCVNDGLTFESTSAAARHYGTRSSNVCGSASRGNVLVRWGLKFEYIDGSTPQPIDRKHLPVRCVETNVVHKSMAKAARAVGVTPQAIRRAVRERAACRGFHFEFLS